MLINGSPTGYFHSKKELRQGDPLSPYLFTLAMEVFSKMIERQVQVGNIQLIAKCKAIKLTHLAFANDLMLMTKADAQSLRKKIHIIESFDILSGLQINREKSIQLLARVEAEEKQQLLEITRFKEGKLPMQYLGVPLIYGKLAAGDCNAGRKIRPLSYARRLELIKSVLQSCYIYWSGVFGLPGRIMKQIESTFARFLWAGPDLSKKLHAMSWEKICRPKEERGLNIIRVKHMN